LLLSTKNYLSINSLFILSVIAVKPLQTFLFFCPSVHLSICCPFFHLSVCPLFCLSLRLSVRSSLCLSVSNLQVPKVFHKNSFSRSSVKQEPSVSPPPKYSLLNHAKESLIDSPSTSQRKRTVRKSSADSEQDKRGKKKAKAKKEGAASNPDGSKRVYVCPHCQRSYDWNYNLNRHLVPML
jgi:hypothetical protein